LSTQEQPPHGDYTGEPPVDSRDLALPGTVPYDPEPRRERVRGWLAAALVGLVAFEVVAAFLALALGAETANIRSLLEVLFAPSVALAGSATGFYFAGKSGA
jgi:hypothetical protein